MSRPALDLSVYVVVDSRAARGRPPEAITEAALAGGATVIQLREKAMATRELVRTAGRLRALTRQAGVPLIINDRVDVALAVDADGVHLGPEDLEIPDARRLLGTERIIGFSAGTEEEAVAAERVGADYLGVGSVFATPSKADAGPPIGLAALRRIARAVRVPVVAVGGLSADNAAEAIRAGAAGVAVISAVVGAEDVAAATRALAEVVHAARR